MGLKKEKVKVIALTGGIGTGKSTVGSFLRAKNIPVIDADQLSREVCKPSLPAYSEIIALLGEDILLPSNELNRVKLKELIFADAELKKKIEAIIHPRIQAEFQKIIKALIERRENIIFYEIPLLFEAKSNYNFDFIVCVDAPDHTRIERILKQRDISTEEIKKIISFQKSQEEKKMKSNYTINNAGSIENTKKEVLEVLKRIQA